MIRLYALLVAAALALSFWAGWSWRGDRGDGARFRQQAGVSAALADQVNQARETEHTHADNVGNLDPVPHDRLHQLAVVFHDRGLPGVEGVG